MFCSFVCFVLETGSLYVAQAAWLPNSGIIGMGHHGRLSVVGGSLCHISLSSHPLSSLPSIPFPSLMADVPELVKTVL
jgi:hypothetical protein